MTAEKQRRRKVSRIRFDRLQSIFLGRDVPCSSSGSRVCVIRERGGQCVLLIINLSCSCFCFSQRPVTITQFQITPNGPAKEVPISSEVKRCSLVFTAAQYILGAVGLGKQGTRAPYSWVALAGATGAGAGGIQVVRALLRVWHTIVTTAGPNDDSE